MLEFLVNFVKAQPLLSIILFSLIITTILTFVYKKLTNQARMKEIKAKQKELQEKAKNEKDKEKALQINQEMMKSSAEMMKMSFKPMIITFLPLILIFAGLRALYTSANVGNIINWEINVPILCGLLPGVCDGAGWFLCYVIFSFAFSLILNKLFKNF